MRGRDRGRKEGREGERVKESVESFERIEDFFFFVSSRPGYPLFDFEVHFLLLLLLLLRGEGRAGLPAYTYHLTLTIKDNPINPTHGFSKP